TTISRPVSVTNPDRGHILLPSPAAGEEPAPGANGKIPRSAPERPTSPGLVQQAGLEPLPASPSRLSVRRQNESPRSMHGDGPYCYLNNPGFEPCQEWSVVQVNLQERQDRCGGDSRTSQVDRSGDAQGPTEPPVSGEMAERGGCRLSSSHKIVSAEITAGGLRCVDLTSMLSGF